MKVKHVTFIFSSCRQFTLVSIKKVHFPLTEKIESSNSSLGLKLRVYRRYDCTWSDRRWDIRRYFYLFKESVINHVRVRRFLSRLRSFLRFHGACYRFVNLNVRPTLYIPVLHPRLSISLFSIFSSADVSHFLGLINNSFFIHLVLFREWVNNCGYWCFGILS